MTCAWRALTRPDDVRVARTDETDDGRRRGDRDWGRDRGRAHAARCRGGAVTEDVRMPHTVDRKWDGAH